MISQRDGASISFFCWYNYVGEAWYNYQKAVTLTLLRK